MGLRDKLREHAQGKRDQREAAEYQQAIGNWEAYQHQLAQWVDTASDFNGITREDDADLALITKKDERVFYQLTGAALIEPRHLPGQWVGRSQGVSFRVAKGVRYHVGGSKGTFQQGAEVPTPVDSGTATITNQRVVFQGTKMAREWTYAKLLGFQHDDSAHWTAIQVSNRQKVSGLLYDAAHAAEIRFRFELALAHFQDNIDAFRRELSASLASHSQARPTLHSSLPNRGTLEAGPPGNRSGPADVE